MQDQNPRRNKRPSFLQRHGLRGWVVCIVLLLALLFAGVLYFVGRGGTLRVPAPGNLAFPTR
jgi:hypothetical protein